MSERTKSEMTFGPHMGRGRVAFAYEEAGQRQEGVFTGVVGMAEHWVSVIDIEEPDAPAGGVSLPRERVLVIEWA